MHEYLVRRFADAGLTLVLSERPIIGSLRVGGSDIVQFDIQRAGRKEWFRAYPGAVSNRVEVVGLDKKIGQVVTMVHEPPRQFVEQVPFALTSGVDFSSPSWREVVAEKVNVRPSDVVPAVGHKGRPYGANVIRRTPSAKRHFLCGLDESHLFIAQLPGGVSTVRGAHEALRSVPDDKSTVRQGEWFFLVPSAFELHSIEYGLSHNTLFAEHAVPIGPFTVVGGVRGAGRRVRQVSGNPHVADELVVVPGRVRTVFVRGRIRHAEHRTVTFPSWRKVIRNAEATPVGIAWAD